MEITLEKIELVKDRTGVSYKEAKAALEASGGSVVDAIIDIEESLQNSGREEVFDENVNEYDVFSKVKETLSRGNMARILVKKEEETILNLPLSAGVLGAIVAPWGVIFGAIAAAGFNCRIEFINDKGEVTDINGKVKDSYEKAVQSGQETIEKFKESDIYMSAKERGSETLDKIKDSDVYSEMKQRSREAVHKTQEAYEELKAKGLEMRENIWESRSDDEDIREAADTAFKDVSSVGDDLFRDAHDTNDQNE